jgi:hypothetical protein
MNLRLICALWAGSWLLCAQTGAKKLAETDCTVEKLGTSIPVELIAEPVAAVTLSAPVWKPAAAPLPSYCSIDGSMGPVKPAAKRSRFSSESCYRRSGASELLSSAGVV